MSHSASESLPPDTATRTRSPFWIMANCSMALATWSRQSRRKCSAQNPALWRRTSMTPGSRHTRHFISSPPR